MAKTEMTRRSFLAGAGILGAGMAGLTACSPSGGDGATATDKPSEAGSSSAWDEQPASVAGEVGEERDYEVVICGGGNVGVFTGLYLAQAGAKVVILEKSGTCTMWAGDIDALDSNSGSLCPMYSSKSSGFQ